MTNKTTLITHDGRFHCDEVCGTAIIKLLGLIPNFNCSNVIRTRNKNVFIDRQDAIILDVGEKHDPEQNFMQILFLMPSLV